MKVKDIEPGMKVTWHSDYNLDGLEQIQTPPLTITDIRVGSPFAFKEDEAVIFYKCSNPSCSTCMKGRMFNHVATLKTNGKSLGEPSQWDKKERVTRWKYPPLFSPYKA